MMKKMVYPLQPCALYDFVKYTQGLMDDSWLKEMQNTWGPHVTAYRRQSWHEELRNPD